jgi:hypothetical protein
MGKKGRPRKWFKWTVEVKVHRSWVEDGFDLDNERAHHMLGGELPHAYGDEFKAKVTSRPPRTEIRKAQGYRR